MPISPHSIIFGAPILLILIPALQSSNDLINNVELNLIISFGLFGSLFASFIFKIPEINNYSSKKKLSLPKYIVSTGTTIYGLYLSLTILKIFIDKGGIYLALSTNRLENYLGGEILKGGGYELFLLAPEVLYFFYISELLSQKKYFRALSLISLLSLFNVFTANTRLPMLMPFIALAFIMIGNFFRRRWLPLLMPLILSSGILFVFLFGVIGNLIRSGDVDNIQQVWSELQEKAIIQKSDDLGYYNWLNDLHYKITYNELSYDYGAAWVYYGPISIVPRFLWPNKPITSTSNRLTEAVYHLNIGDGVPITTFTIYGEGFWQAGYIGAFIAGFIFLGLYSITISAVNQFNYSNYWSAMLLIHMVTFFRGELPTPQFIINIILILLFYLILKKNPVILFKQIKSSLCLKLY